MLGLKSIRVQSLKKKKEKLPELNLDDTAIVSFKKAIQLDPCASGPYREIGLIYLEMGLMDEAIIYLRKGIGLGRVDGRSYFYLA